MKGRLAGCMAMQRLFRDMNMKLPPILGRGQALRHRDGSSPRTLQQNACYVAVKCTILVLED